MKTAEDILDRMKVLIDFIIDARDAAREGKMTDLAGLDEEVSSLCDRTLALPPDQAQEVQPQMAVMIGHLEELGQALQEFQTNKQKT